jgi:hypothetical protein
MLYAARLNAIPIKYLFGRRQVPNGIIQHYNVIVIDIILSFNTLVYAFFAL